MHARFSFKLMMEAPPVTHTSRFLGYGQTSPMPSSFARVREQLVRSRCGHQRIAMHYWQGTIKIRWVTETVGWEGWERMGGWMVVLLPNLRKISFALSRSPPAIRLDRCLSPQTPPTQNNLHQKCIKMAQKGT